jgi:hypothetical protein
MTSWVLKTFRAFNSKDIWDIMNIKATTIIKDMMEITCRGKGGRMYHMSRTNQQQNHRPSRHHGHSSQEGYYVWYIAVVQEIQRFKYLC